MANRPKNSKQEEKMDGTSMEIREILDMAMRLMSRADNEGRDLLDCVIEVKQALAEAQRPGTPEEKHEN